MKETYWESQRSRLEARWRELAKTDPHWRATWALAKRAGFDWYDTESSARRMADHAAGELLELLALLTDVVNTVDDWSDTHEVLERAKAAIAKLEATT